MLQPATTRSRYRPCPMRRQPKVQSLVQPLQVADGSDSIIAPKRNTTTTISRSSSNSSCSNCTVPSSRSSVSSRCRSPVDRAIKGLFRLEDPLHPDQNDQQAQEEFSASQRLTQLSHTQVAPEPTSFNVEDRRGSISEWIEPSMNRQALLDTLHSENDNLRSELKASKEINEDLNSNLLDSQKALTDLSGWLTHVTEKCRSLLMRNRRYEEQLAEVSANLDTVTRERDEALSRQSTFFRYSADSGSEVWHGKDKDFGGEAVQHRPQSRQSSRQMLPDRVQQTERLAARKPGKTARRANGILRQARRIRDAIVSESPKGRWHTAWEKRRRGTSRPKSRGSLSITDTLPQHLRPQARRQAGEFSRSTSENYLRY
ncbi:hypothetical protein QFC22_003813 [Naganishia vaughanmartiniae]|uniref:Uncharacterized protein n=1 Tax=Naganishia vaughanmartiniae TaxID=1424756 RepID=A0ACC2X4F1_9TREE|nr:hypothetical protein QFC22_003813 [Naganishia vaughanmartiniae]